LSTSARLNASQVLPPAFQAKGFNFNLESNDYRQKLKYLLQKNQNIKKMYHLDLGSTEERRRKQRRAMIIDSGKLRSLPLSSRLIQLIDDKKIRRANSAPNLMSRDLDGDKYSNERLMNTTRIQLFRNSDHDFSQEDMRISNESEEHHNRPQAAKVNQKELEILK
jgi:hypothetical protein